MATSQTVGWNLTVDEIVDQALQIVGGEPTNAKEQRIARRILNLVLRDIQNDVPLAFNVKLKSLALTDGTSTTTLPTSVTDVLDAVIRVSAGQDVTIDRIGIMEFNHIANKEQEGRPTTYATEKLRDGVMIRFWPEADASYTFNYYGIIRPDNVTTAQENLDIHTRFLPAVVAGLAYELSKTRRQIDENYRQRLKVDYAEKLQRAQEEDRERVSWVITPELR